MAAIRTRVVRGRPAQPVSFRAFDGPPARPAPAAPPAEAFDADAFGADADAVAAEPPAPAAEPPEPFAFGPLDAPPPEPDPFVPIPALGDVPPPRPPSREFEAGRLAAQAEHDAEVAALRDERDQLSAALDEARAVASEESIFAATAADRLVDEWAGAVRQLEGPLVELALEVAEAVLDAPLPPEARAASEAALSAAVAALADGAPLEVAIHPVDLLRLRESGLADAVGDGHPGLRWEADPALTEGDWAVTTPTAAVRRVRAEMMAAFRERLGLG